MESGNAAEWVAAIFTGLGFLGAIAQLRASRNDAKSAREDARREEEANREAMARAVGVKASWQPGPDGKPPAGHDGLMPVSIEVLNSGPFPINFGFGDQRAGHPSR